MLHVSLYLVAIYFCQYNSDACYYACFTLPFTYLTSLTFTLTFNHNSSPLPDSLESLSGDWQLLAALKFVFFTGSELALKLKRWRCDEHLQNPIGSQESLSGDWQLLAALIDGTLEIKVANNDMPKCAARWHYTTFRCSRTETFSPGLIVP